MTDRSDDLLVPNETYVLVKRFSAKEERKRIVAAVHQLRDAGIVLVNPDKPDRPINSGQTVYQLELGPYQSLPG